MPVQPLLLPALSLFASVVILGLLWRWRVLHPKAFGASPSQQRDVWPIPAPIWFVCAAMVFLAQPLGLTTAASLPAHIRGASGTMQARGVEQALAYLMAIITAVAILWLLQPRVSAKTGLGFRWSKDLSAALVALLCVVPICIFLGWAGQQVQSLISGKVPDAVSHDTLKLLVNEPRTLWWWCVMTAAILGAPIAEECIFRAFLQTCLLSALGRTWPAIILTSLLFTAAHTSSVPWTALPVLFALSIAIGTAFERTRSLGVPILMHVLFNVGNVVLAVLTISK